MYFYEYLRWIWVLCLIMLLGLAVNIVKETVDRFLDRPTYIVKSEKTRRVMEFPLVQVCPEVYFPEDKMDDFVSKIRFPPDLNMTYIRSVLQQLAGYYAPDVKYSTHHLKWIEHLLDYNGIDVYTATLQMTLSCEETLLKCRWKGLRVDCQNLFKMELTSYGFCCVFNGRSLRREIQEYGVHTIRPRIKYYTRSVGVSSGLIVAVNQSSVLADIDLSYKWVAIDGGQNYVEANINGTPLSPGTELWMGHKNRGFGLSDDAKVLDTTLRGCHLTTEGLKLFPVYRRKYCQLECKIAYYLRTCHCVLITFPAPPSIPRCRARHMDCIKRISEIFSQENCDCTHTCDVDTDHVALSTIDLAPSGSVMDKFYDDLDFSKVTVIRVYIIRRQVKISSRRSVYTHLDLFGQLGGVFNLFFGFSILSILELFQLAWYYFKNRRNSKRDDQTKIKRRNIKNNEVKIKKIRPRELVFKEGVDKKLKTGKTVRFHRSEMNPKLKSRINTYY